jgi:hypothetical protein
MSATRTLAALALGLVAGCGHGVSTEPGACTPGQSIACACTDGRHGAQSCAANGTYDPCSCTGSGDGGGPHKLVFITSATFSGNLVVSGSQPTGLAAADALCATAATAAGLGASFRAWLSDGNTNAIDRIADVGPWYLTDGTLVFHNKANLATTALAAINRNENGAPVNQWDGSYAQWVWTGTQIGGVRAAQTCNDWSSVSGNGAVGRFDAPDQWTGNGSLDCSGDSYHMHLYCLQQ